MYLTIYTKMIQFREKNRNDKNKANFFILKMFFPRIRNKTNIF